MQMQISKARSNAFMKKAVAILVISVSLPLIIIGGGELLALAPAINGGLTSMHILLILLIGMHVLHIIMLILLVVMERG